jgi:hypothetical protein
MPGGIGDDLLRMCRADPPAIGPLLCVVGAPRNCMKMAPLLRAFATQPRLPRTVPPHTGQHYAERPAVRRSRAVASRSESRGGIRVARGADGRGDEVFRAGRAAAQALLRDRGRRKTVPARATLARAAFRNGRLDDAAGSGVVTMHRPTNVDDPPWRIFALLACRPRSIWR